jgi:nitrous oxidase accessory protein NosD
MATVLALLVAGLAAGCSSADAAPRAPSVVRVPGDAATISQAVDRVAENGLVLVSPGVYRESVTIEKPGITLRGTDRDGVVIDGEGVRAKGIVVTAPGVTVENLTVRAHTFYGVLVTGMPDGGTGGAGAYAKVDPDRFPPVQRFRVDHVTAVGNGLYGIYAFDAQHGVIESSYASGSADSGFYVGQCRRCDVLVRGNVAERNAIGFENANASDSVYIVGNRWSGNRVGMTLISSYQEAFTPQRGNTVVGNLISDNTSADSPAQADGGFGIGVGISGGQDNELRGNRITGNPRAGVLLSNAEDIPAAGNRLAGNELTGNGVDVADESTAQAPSSGNCVGAATAITVLPAVLAAAVCPSVSATSAGITAAQLPGVAVPPGMSFLDVPGPRPQPGLPHVAATPPTRLPARIGAPDLSAVPTPSDDYLAELIGTP